MGPWTLGTLYKGLDLGPVQRRDQAWIPFSVDRMTDRQTDMMENIIFPQLHWQAVIIFHKKHSMTHPGPSLNYPLIVPKFSLADNRVFPKFPTIQSWHFCELLLSFSFICYIFSHLYV